MTARRRFALAAAILCVAVAALVSPTAKTATTRAPVTTSLDADAAAYLALASELAQRDPDFIDARLPSGPEPAAPPRPLATIAADADALVERLRSASPSDAERGRRDHLTAQTDAVGARAQQLAAMPMPLDDELRRVLGIRRDDIGDTSASSRSAAGMIGRLPGRGGPAERLEAFEAALAVPVERVPAVFARALDECRDRTAVHVALPGHESVTVSYVQGRPWSGYSRYLGAGQSRLEINTGLPLTVDGILELACHEGYPGHHVFSTLRDQQIVRGHGWKEYGVTPLFTPDGFEAEAAASLAASMIFSTDERVRFERDTLSPLAGTDASRTERAVAIAALRGQLEQSTAPIIVRYLAGELDVVEAAWALRDEALMAHPLPTLQFVNRYRGYALAYAYGRARLTTLIGPSVPVEARWRNYLAIVNGTDVAGATGTR